MPTYLVAAYILFWLVPFALVLTMWRRQQRLEQQVVALRRALPPERRGDGVRRL
ncbi:MAG: hypothetical protein ACYC5O_19785 [Anaerolineae bacterium]